VNVVVDFVKVARSDVSANVVLNVNSNHVKAISWSAIDVNQNIELVLDVYVYGVGEVDMTGNGDS
jgi:hypothetical protein